MNRRTLCILILLLSVLFGPTTGQARYLNSNTGRFQTMDSYEGNNSDQVSLHKYLYGNANPVNMTDPSGRFSLMEIVSVQGIQKTLNTIKNTRVVRFWTRGLRDKTTDINLVTTRTVPGLPSHWYIYVDRRSSSVDLAYHVGVEDVRGFIRGGLSKYANVFPGEFSIVPTTGAEVRLDAFKVIKVASLNNKQFAAWNAIVIPLGMVGDTAEIPYSVPGYPLTFNCYKWTVEAAAAALFLQFFPF